MATGLTVMTLAGFPAINTTLQRSAGTPAANDGITHAYATGTAPAASYVPSPGTIFVAGILDQQGINPSRIFYADNGTGGGSQGTYYLPTLISVTQVGTHGQSLQELPSNRTANSYDESADAVGYAGFIVLLSAAAGQPDDGIYPLGYDNAILASGGPGNYANVPGWTSQGGAYTNAAITVGYPNPQMRFFVSMSALLIVAGTNLG